MTGKIIKVIVRLINLSHGRPGDIDIMLGGIMSSVGRIQSVTNVKFTLDDLAPTAIFDPLVFGTFKSTKAEAVICYSRCILFSRTLFKSTLLSNNTEQLGL